MLDDLEPVWVDTSRGVTSVAAACAATGPVALDTEADSLHSYFHKVCLIQVTAGATNFVIDPLALEPDALAPLWRLVEDPELPVLMHGADYDIRVLDRDYGVRVRGLVDTQIMAQLLGEPKTGLAALLENELGVTLDKRHQRADWGRRPLKSSQVSYAAADTAYLEPLAVRLRERLRELGRWEWAEEDFRRLEEVRHQPAEPNPRAFERVKGVRTLRGEARDRAFTLFEWREGEAQRLDVPPFKVLGNASLVALSEQPPTTKAELGSVDGIGPRFIRRWGRAVLRALSRPDPAPTWQKAPRQPDLPPDVVRRVKRLSAVRDAVAAELGLDPGLVCSKSCVVAVASQAVEASGVIELAAAGLTGWRRRVLEAPFLEVLTDG